MFADTSEWGVPNRSAPDPIEERHGALARPARAKHAGGSKGCGAAICGDPMDNGEPMGCGDPADCGGYRMGCGDPAG